MRQIRYGVAMSLDGYIASLDGGYDWIVMDPDIDFGAIFRRFDTLLMGRRTFEMAGSGGGGGAGDVKTVVVSSTLRPEDHPGVRLITTNVAEEVARLRAEPGKDIWLFGGGQLFRSLLAARLVDGLDVAIVPVVLGGGIPFLPTPAPRVTLELVGERRYPKSGIISLDYRVQDETSAGSKPRKRSRR